MAFEFDVVVFGLVITVVALAAGFIYFILNFRTQNRANKRADMRSDEYISKIDKGQVDALAERVRREQDSTAERLKAQNEQIAEKVKTSMESYIDSKITELKIDYTHKFDVMELKLKSINDVIAHVMEKIAETSVINARTAERLEKGLDFLKQFMWGQGAKSDPPYLTGKVETEEHKEEEGKGIFKDTKQEAKERKEENKKLD